MSEEKKTPKDSLKSNGNGFIRQKIVKQKMTLKQKVLKILFFVFSALLFGVLACCAFVLSRPWCEKLAGEPPVTESVSIPPDTDPVMNENTSEEAESSEPLEDIVQSAIEENELDIGDYISLFGSLREVAFEADKSVVSIQVIRQDTDWFENTFVHSGTLSGIIIYKTTQEIMILTRQDAISGANSLEVSLSQDISKPGSVKQEDHIANLAIITVSTEGISQDILDSLKTISWGNSLTLRMGEPLIAIGSPSGSVHSSTYGMSVGIRKNVPLTDGVIRIIETDCLAEDNAPVFFVNLNGELVGILNNTFRMEGSGKFASAMSISDLKTLIEKMANGKGKGYLGINGAEITDSISETTGLPKGVYVQEAITNSPAYGAGIQSGDIIVEIGGQDILTLKDLQTQLDSVTAGDTVSVKALRSGVEEYKEIEFSVGLTGR